MSDVIRQETTVFFLAIALGAGLSFFDDFLRVLRRMIRHGAVATGMRGSSVLAVWRLPFVCADVLRHRRGAARGYVLLGTLCGALLYLQTAGPLLIRGGTAMAGYIRRKRKKMFFHIEIQ